MNKSIFVMLVLALLSGFMFLGASHSVAASSNSGTWKGYVTDTYCGVNRDTKAPTRACTYDCVKNKNAKFAFYSLEDKNVYILTPQDLAAKYAGQLVNLTGTIGDGISSVSTMKGVGQAKTITVVEISPAK